MTLEVGEFIRRFLLHVLPKGFVRIRHFGFLANPRREQKLALCRKLLGNPVAQKQECSVPEEPNGVCAKFNGDWPALCLVCRQGQMVVVEIIGARRRETHNSLRRLVMTMKGWLRSDDGIFYYDALGFVHKPVRVPGPKVS